MDLYHNLFYDKAKIALHSARLMPNQSNNPRILDVGCGTGFWAIDMAEYVRARSKKHDIPLILKLVGGIRQQR